MARDFELLCRPICEPKINDLGISYGSLLGATYANLFPDEVRVMVLLRKDSLRENPALPNRFRVLEKSETRPRLAADAFVRAKSVLGDLHMPQVGGTIRRSRDVA